MLLNDIGKSPTTTFRKINQHLEANYGFKISESVSDKDLVSIMENIEGEIIELKVKGDDAKASPEISKRLLILEGLKTLREFVLMNFKSPDFDRVVDGLADYAAGEFRLAGSDQSYFDEAVKDAMKHYRSSKYRFPDDMVEQCLRERAMSLLNETGFEEDAFGEELLMPPEEQVQPEPTTDFDKQEECAGMVYESSEEKGITMREHANLVKNLRRLLETEVSQAEVMMAAKGFAQELQEMIEKIGRLQNEDLPPVTDQMRETYGMQSSSAFQTQIYGALQGVMDALYTAKGQVDDAVSNMASTGQFSAETDMDKDLGAADDMGGLDTPDADLDNLAADLGDEEPVDTGEFADEFGGAEEEEPLGRAKKVESVERLQNKVLEMKKLVEKAKKLKEAKKSA